MKRPKEVPVWLRRLERVKAELREVTFPRTAEEGLRQAAALSVACLRMLEEEVASAKGRRLLLARLSRLDARRTLFWKKERARCFGR